MIVLSGEPKSTQTLYRYACRGRHAKMYMTRDGKKIKERYQWEARSQWKEKLLAGPVRVEITLYHGTKRVSDWDNFHKLSMDALTDIVWKDDSQIVEAHVKKRYDKSNPRIEIEVYETL